MPDPSLTCAQLAAAQGYLAIQLEKPAPNGSGSVLIDIRWQPAAGATRPVCDGPVSSIRVRNNSDMTAWANLPNKKRGSKWVQGDPGTDVTISSPGQLNNLGLSNRSDVDGVIIVWTQPV